MFNSIFNIAMRRVGGLTFIKFGRLTISFSVSREYKPFKDSVAERNNARYTEWLDITNAEAIRLEFQQ